MVFGADVSGRPPDLDGVEYDGRPVHQHPAACGCRCGAASRWTAWLRRLQAEQVELRQYEHSPLAQIQSWSDDPGGPAAVREPPRLPELPASTRPRPARAAGGLELGDATVAEQANYPLDLRGRAGRAPGDADRVDRRALRSERCAPDAGPSGGGSGGAPRGAGRAGRGSAVAAGCRSGTRFCWSGTDRLGRMRRRGTVHGLFAEHGPAAPGCPGGVLGEESLSYARAPRRGRTGWRAICARSASARRWWWACWWTARWRWWGLLGILVAGGAYVPLDPAYPAERLAYMLDDAGARLVLTPEPLAEVLAGWDGASVAPRRRRRLRSIGRTAPRRWAGGAARAAWPMSSTPRARRAGPKGWVWPTRRWCATAWRWCVQLGLQASDRHAAIRLAELRRAGRGAVADLAGGSGGRAARPGPAAVRRGAGRRSRSVRR